MAIGLFRGYGSEIRLHGKFLSVKNGSCGGTAPRDGDKSVNGVKNGIGKPQAKLFDSIMLDTLYGGVIWEDTVTIPI